MIRKLFMIFFLCVILGEAKKSFLSFLDIKQTVMLFFEKTEETIIVRSSYEDKQPNSSYLLVKLQDPKVLHVVNVTKTTLDATNFAINLLMDQEGETSLNIQLWDSEGRQKRLIEEIKNVRVKVHKPSQDRPTQAPVHDNRYIPMLILPMILLNKCAFGCKIEFQVLQTVWRRPLPIIIGEVTHFFLMPFCGFLLSQILALPEAQAFGFIMTCTCPEGGGSYLFALLLEGDVTVAILMTCISTSMALIMMPINSYIYSRLLGLSGIFHIPVFKIVSTLLFILIPVSVGIIIKKRTPGKANLLETIVQPLCFLLMLAGIYLTFQMGSLLLKSAQLDMLLLGLLVPALGLLFGYSFSHLCRLPLPVCKTVAFESGMQNSFLALAIIQFSFSQPEANLASVAPFTIAMCSGCEMLLILLIYRAKRYLCYRK
ncbi:sodium/bile acid cotransporter 5 [Perognathus longimembris pacificus]|uniref:sodium/bile acid cotransporter 5 n=1 Tax=Perognathus longimembris pacificus TaxID=214514 RepID=UPI0020190788|nr:sodium/bile acid cotransporter 5 [Perognathus longimembris pacificus]